MFGGLIALLDDVAVFAKAAAASLDDVAAGAAKASSKAVAVVVDDTAVTPQYFASVKPARELPMVWRIAKGSLRNKLLIILPAIIILSILVPWIFTILLILGGAYLSFEGAEKIWHKIRPPHEGEHASSHAHEVIAADTPEEAKAMAKSAEDKLVKGATTTDFILSTEVMLVAFNSVLQQPLVNRILIMIGVALIITAGVYGMVALIIKMDDFGLAIAKKSKGWVQKFGFGIVKAMPTVMAIITAVGTIAMLWVGGHLVIKGIADLGWDPIYMVGHHLAEHVHHISGVGAALAWLAETVWSALCGCAIGTLVMLVVNGVTTGISRIRSK